jgi:hypothetical protein
MVGGTGSRSEPYTASPTIPTTAFEPKGRSPYGGSWAGQREGRADQVPARKEPADEHLTHHHDRPRRLRVVIVVVTAGPNGCPIGRQPSGVSMNRDKAFASGRGSAPGTVATMSAAEARLRGGFREPPAPATPCTAAARTRRWYNGLQSAAGTVGAVTIIQRTRSRSNPSDTRWSTSPETGPPGSARRRPCVAHD